MKVKATDSVQEKIVNLPIEVRKKIAYFLKTIEKIETSRGTLEMDRREWEEFNSNNYVLDKEQRIYATKIGNYGLFYTLEDISESEEAVILLEIVKRE